ncbi:hypothetical protein J6590_037738 [Homalodisca vitripennis]|nr:hypothetical protein J6590_037738 [Homalodisca vitripennis]
MVYPCNSCKPGFSAPYPYYKQHFEQSTWSHKGEDLIKQNKGESIQCKAGGTDKKCYSHRPDLNLEITPLIQIQNLTYTGLAARFHSNSLCATLFTFMWCSVDIETSSTIEEAVAGYFHNESEDESQDGVAYRTSAMTAISITQCPARSTSADYTAPHCLPVVPQHVRE